MSGSRSGRVGRHGISAPGRVVTARTMGSHMKATIIEVAASHMAMLVKPEETAELIGKEAL